MSGHGQKLRIYDKAAAQDMGLLEHVYPDILARSFPIEELGAPWVLGHMPEGELLVATEDDREGVLGCAIGEEYPESGVFLLGYLAVHPAHRGKGVGSALMRAALERWQRPGTSMLAEIDDPRHHEVHEDYGDPWARMRFYEAFGLMALAAPYFQPSLDGFPRAYHLMLCYFKPAGPPPAQEDGTAVSGQVVSTFLREYFTACEGEDALADPQVRWLLSFYRDQVGLVPLSELDRIPHPQPPRI